ncbi:DUF92 domain-containing protein [Pleomorphochaeta sp. DL1XJH-081]|jgi:uncharacterized protein (TIGR00297 family)|uniref:DUF92 domain-containing protein n=1 Tax=Pleomorphochaeta sp. DL1XJH-081 TaxID=3409690 RepID=UPI003BB79E6A
MSTDIWRILIPLFANIALAVISYILHWLTLSGAVSALLVGFLTYRFTGFGGWALLMLFFITANILGKVSRAVSRAIDNGIQKKGGTRDWAQVMANGGLAAAAALLYGLDGGRLGLVMFGAAIAASTADTWAGEAGILSRKPPISIKTFKPVPTGMSGGVSLLGTLSSLLGSILIAIAWYATFADFNDSSWVFLASIIAVAGMVGSLVDSYFGATIQGHYYDPESKRITEHEQRNGKKLELCRGIRWIDNDVVNFLSNVIAVLLGWGLSLIIL